MERQLRGRSNQTEGQHTENTRDMTLWVFDIMGGSDPQEVAKRASVPVEYLINVLGGLVNPSEEFLRRIGQALELETTGHTNRPSCAPVAKDTGKTIPNIQQQVETTLEDHLVPPDNVKEVKKRKKVSLYYVPEGSLIVSLHATEISKRHNLVGTLLNNPASVKLTADAGIVLEPQGRNTLQSFTITAASTPERQQYLMRIGGGRIFMHSDRACYYNGYIVLTQDGNIDTDRSSVDIEKHLIQGNKRVDIVLENVNGKTIITKVLTKTGVEEKQRGIFIAKV